jgi:hypothetical protein
MKLFIGLLLSVATLLALPGVGRGGDGVLPLKINGEGTAVGGPFPQPAKQAFNVDISNFAEMGSMNPNIRCRLATQPSDQVVLEGLFVVGGHAYNLSALCRNPTGTQYEIFAQRLKSGAREQLKFEGNLIKDQRGVEMLTGTVKLH